MKKKSTRVWRHWGRVFASICMLSLSGCGGGSGAGDEHSSAYCNHISVSGLSSNELVTLENNGGAALTLRANGTSAFPATQASGNLESADSMCW
jgi:hypothetical protein